MVNFSELEVQVRKEAPLDSYGYLGYLTSQDYPIYRDNSELRFRGDLNYKIGYNCFDISELILQKIKERGLNGEIAITCNTGIWDEHAYCIINNNVTLDGTPLFLFEGEKHELSYIYNGSSEDKSLNCFNPLTLIKKDNKTYIIGLIPGIEIIEGDNYPLWIESDILCFGICIHEIETGIIHTESYKVNLKEYMNRYSKLSIHNLLNWDELNLKRNKDIIPEIVSTLSLPNKYKYINREAVDSLSLNGIHKSFSYIVSLFIHKVAYAEF